MISFAELPKQWLIARTLPDAIGGVTHPAFQGWQIRTAAHVPVISLFGADGADLGRVIGWAIMDGVFYREDATLTLGPEDTPETLFERTGGRFVMFWQNAEGRLLMREDGSGLLPAIYAPGHGAVGSTITALEMLGPLTPDAETIAIYDFPKRKGYLPFGLTPRSDAHRLMPNQALDLGTFTKARVWPDAQYCNRTPMTPDQCAAVAKRCVQVVCSHLQAITDAQGETVLYLSAGNDSRAILAAAITGGLEKQLVFHTITTKGSLDPYIAAKLARRLGRPHKTITIGRTSADQIQQWITRAGHMIFDTVTETSGTMQTEAPDTNPLAGTGADLMRNAHWPANVAEMGMPTVSDVLEQLRYPDVPPVRRAAEAWLASMPETADAALIFDLAKLELRHACWSGTSIYGLAVAYPTLHPFSGHPLNSLVLNTPINYRTSASFYRDYIAQSAPWMAEIPANKPVGFDRIRFWKHELRRMVPTRIKRLIKPY